MEALESKTEVINRKIEKDARIELKLVPPLPDPYYKSTTKGKKTERVYSNKFSYWDLPQQA